MGDRGHPCLVPFVMGNGLENIPSVYTNAEGEEYKAIMAFCNRPQVQTFPGLWTSIPNALYQRPSLHLKSEAENALCFPQPNVEGLTFFWLHL